MKSRSKDIIILLGAGASAEAGIPTSGDMIGRIEEHLDSRADWTQFADLYNHVKSAIYYSAGLRGRFNHQVTYNIETLVNTLYELERNEDHPLYPFIASWNSRFVALAKPDFAGVRSFRRLILAALKRWMCPEDTSKGDYYRGLVTLQQDLNFPLPVFSLNYDLCVERLAANGVRVETGFGGYGPQHIWDWERFDELGPNPPPQIALYKLHGSINWKRSDLTKELFAVEQIESIDADQMEVIFGRDFKLEAADPYLFYAYEFRRYSLEARLIVSLGYGFGDLHINKMLSQAVRSDAGRRLLVVCNCSGENSSRRSEEIADLMELGDEEQSRVIVHPGCAKGFLEGAELAAMLKAHIPEDPEVPF
ncbi:MAG TPA: SIR2 family protein [Phycisphaerales bacterium]|nr:SIR2 family protein [Phycisphaerales bacterium]